MVLEKYSKICVLTWVNGFWIGIKSFYVILDFPFGPQYSLDPIFRLWSHFSSKHKYFIYMSVDKISGRKIIFHNSLKAHPHFTYPVRKVANRTSYFYWTFGRAIFRAHTIQVRKTSIILFVCFMDGYEYLMRTQVGIHLSIYISEMHTHIWLYLILDFGHSYHSITPNNFTLFHFDGTTIEVKEIKKKNIEAREC